MRRTFLCQTIIVLLLLCTACTGNSVSEKESPDITIARQAFYQEGRTQFVAYLHEYQNRVPADAVGFLPDVTVSELENAELGKPLHVWNLKRGAETGEIELVPGKCVTEQIVFESTYLFPVIVEGRMLADYTACIEKGKLTGSFCSLQNRMQCAYDVAQANTLDIQQCRLVAGPGECMFLFFVKNGKEICSGELKKNATTDLVMSENNAVVFKNRVAAFNQELQKPAPVRLPEKQGDNAPLGKAPPFFTEH